MSLSINIGRPFLNDKTLDEQARSVLRLYGTDAHVYLPGANGVAVSGLNSGNYVESTFSTLASVDSVVGGVRDPVGSIDATQATTANKPALRRGLYNLLTYSNDLSNAAWTPEYTASKSGSNILTPAVGDDVYQGTTVAAGSYTLAAQLSGTGTCSLFAYNATDHIHGVTQITLTSTPTIFVGGITSTVANTFYYIGRRTGDTATSITFGGAGLFAGTLTAAQILAEGGIPLTTSAAASNPSAGRYSWQFDGSNDSLALGSVPFQMSDDFLIVGAVRFGNPTSWSTVFSVSGATTTPRIQLFCDNASGFIRAYLRDDAGANVNPGGTVDVRGTSVVATLWKVGTNVYLRVNGVQVATASVSTFGAMALTGASIGRLFNGTDYMSGDMGQVISVKGTFTENDVLTIERLCAANTPSGPSF